MASMFNFIFSRNRSGSNSNSSNEGSCAVTPGKAGKKTMSQKEKRKIPSDCYDPRKSIADDNTIEDFIRAPLSRDMESVPGVGPANAEMLRNEGVDTPHQLLAVYLMLSGLTEDPVDLSDRFYYWLQMAGVNSNRNTIVEVVARKTNHWVPGVYDGGAY